MTVDKMNKETEGIHPLVEAKFERRFVMTNYLYQAEIAAEIMNEWVENNPEYREEWEAWDWL